jgi:hypothetical protein
LGRYHDKESVDEYMILKIIKYIKSFFIEENTVDALGNKRSTKWPMVRKKHIEKNPTCAVCGSKEELQVHHCIPFYIEELKELEEENLITLCEKNNCHFMFGHLCCWHSYNSNIREDAAKMLEKIKNRPMK